MVSGIERAWDDRGRMPDSRPASPLNGISHDPAGSTPRRGIHDDRPGAGRDGQEIVDIELTDDPRADVVGQRIRRAGRRRSPAAASSPRSGAPHARTSTTIVGTVGRRPDRHGCPADERPGRCRVRQSWQVLHLEVQEVRRAADARVVAADELLEAVRRLVVRAGPGRSARRAARSASMAAWFWLVGGTIWACATRPSLVELVSVEEQAARRLGRPGGDRRARASTARAARRRRLVGIDDVERLGHRVDELDRARAMLQIRVVGDLGRRDPVARQGGRGARDAGGRRRG